MRLVSLFIIFIDQITKYIAINKLKGQGSINIIGEFINLTYLENTGAAFGILRDKTMFFILITVFVIIGIFIYMYKNKNKLTKLTELSLQFIIGGAVGNLIDRLLYGYVIDFIDIRFGLFYNFPIFNIADISVVVGTALLAYVIISEKEVLE